MDKSTQRILVIDDEENMRHMLSVLLQRENFQVSLASNGQQGIDIIRRRQFAVVLCDVKMPEMNGLEFLTALRNLGSNVPIVMMSAFGTVELAVEAMKQGADDFITKPFQGEEVILILEKVLNQQSLKEENESLRKRLREVTGDSENAFSALKGKSEALRKIIAQAGKIARYKTTVLVTGESGTGKELLARGIHQASNRAGKAFVAVNCGSIPESLMESELFGYVKGAFTGADRDKKGIFEEAEGGTLFLDEIGELPAAMQVKLLRVLQENELRPVGAGKVKKIDVRIIAATARDLKDEVVNGKFRQDLFFRLNVLNLHLPPLRERLEDIPTLVNFFIGEVNSETGTKVRGLASETLRLLMQYDWPGNVRELENIIERGVLMAESDCVKIEDLPPNLSSQPHNRRLDDLLGTLSIKKGRRLLEKRLIGRALEATNGNKSKAADILEISYPSLLAKIKEYGI